MRNSCASGSAAWCWLPSWTRSRFTRPSAPPYVLPRLARGLGAAWKNSRPQNLPLRARQVSGESRVREYRIVFRFISPQIYKTTYGLTPKQLRLYLEVRSRIVRHGRRAMCTGAGSGVGPGVRHGPGPALPCALPLPCLSWYPARCDAPQRTFVKRLLAAISRELKASSARTKGASTAGADDDGTLKKMMQIDCERARWPLTHVTSDDSFAEVGKGVSVARFADTAVVGREANEQDETRADAGKTTRSTDDDGVSADPN